MANYTFEMDVRLPVYCDINGDYFIEIPINDDEQMKFMKVPVVIIDEHAEAKVDPKKESVSVEVTVGGV